MTANVLYAEDDENDAFFMRRAFGKLKHPVPLRVVEDGQQAVDYLSGEGDYADRAAHPLPQVLLLDIKMPYLTGRDVLEWVRRQPQFATLPVVMLTSSAQEEDVAFCARTGANAYLLKPAQADKLTSLIESVLAACADRRAAGAESRTLRVPGNQLEVAEKG